MSERMSTICAAAALAVTVLLLKISSTYVYDICVALNLPAQTCILLLALLAATFYRVNQFISAKRNDRPLLLHFAALAMIFIGAVVGLGLVFYLLVAAATHPKTMDVLYPLAVFLIAVIAICSVAVRWRGVLMMIFIVYGIAAAALFSDPRFRIIFEHWIHRQ